LLGLRLVLARFGERRLGLLALALLNRCVVGCLLRALFCLRGRRLGLDPPALLGRGCFLGCFGAGRRLARCRLGLHAVRLGLCERRARGLLALLGLSSELLSVLTLRRLSLRIGCRRLGRLCCRQRCCLGCLALRARLSSFLFRSGCELARLDCLDFCARTLRGLIVRNFLRESGGLRGASSGFLGRHPLHRGLVGALALRSGCLGFLRSAELGVRAALSLLLCVPLRNRRALRFFRRLRLCQRSLLSLLLGPLLLGCRSLCRCRCLHVSFGPECGFVLSGLLRRCRLRRCGCRRQLRFRSLGGFGFRALLLSRSALPLFVGLRLSHHTQQRFRLGALCGLLSQRAGGRRLGLGCGALHHLRIQGFLCAGLIGAGLCERNFRALAPGRLIRSLGRRVVRALRRLGSCRFRLLAALGLEPRLVFGRLSALGLSSRTD